MEDETCKCTCHPVMQVCRVCCVRTAKDESFDLMMKQNQTVLDLQADLDAALLQIKQHQIILESVDIDHHLTRGIKEGKRLHGHDSCGVCLAIERLDRLEEKRSREPKRGE